MRKNGSYAAATVRRSHMWQVGLFAGVSGGLAEIAWISAYAAGTGANAAAVARGVAGAFGLAGGSGAASLGVAIHMVLAGALGIAVVAALQALPMRQRSWRIDLALVLAALGGVWAFNFLVLLPVLSPAFVTMVPMPVSFVSKLLFGIAAFAAYEERASRANRRT